MGGDPVQVLRRAPHAEQGATSISSSGAPNNRFFGLRWIVATCRWGPSAERAIRNAPSARRQVDFREYLSRPGHGARRQAPGAGAVAASRGRHRRTDQPRPGTASRQCGSSHGCQSINATPPADRQGDAEPGAEIVECLGQRLSAPPIPSGLFAKGPSTESIH